MHDRSISPVEYHDLQTKTLLDLLKNISEEAEDYASSNSSSDKIIEKSPMVNLSRQLKKITNECETTAVVGARGPMGNLPVEKASTSPPSTTTTNIQVNVIQPSPVQSPSKTKADSPKTVKGNPTRKEDPLASQAAGMQMIDIDRNDAKSAKPSLDEGKWSVNRHT